MSEERGDSSRRIEIAENLMEATKKVYGERLRNVENEWMRTKEEEE